MLNTIASEGEEQQDMQLDVAGPALKKLQLHDEQGWYHAFGFADGT